MGIASGTIIFVGVVMLICGGVGILWALRQHDRRVRARLLRSQPRSIRELGRSGAEVLVVGRVARGPQGLVRSPITWHDAVLFRTRIMRRKGHRTTTYNVLYREGQEVPFWIDDGSGYYALVRASAYQLVLRVGFQAVGLTITDQLREWIRGRLGQVPNRLKVEEKWISEGDEVTVVGVVEHETGPSGEQFVALTNKPSNPLFLASYSPREAAVELGSNVRVAIGIAATGMVILCVGAALSLFA